MKMKSLTIVVPTYNMEKYLDKCLTSLIVPEKELMDELEVLVINDGSKDGSLEIAQRYQKQYPQTFRVIDKENGNYGSCINRGLKEATGRYIKVLDADDWFDTDNFMEFLDFIKEKDADAFISNFDFVGSNGITKGSWHYQFPNTALNLSELRDLPYNIWMHAVTYKTENLRKIGYRQTEGISYTDQEWIFLPMAVAKVLYFFEKPIYKYLVGREGQTIDVKVWERNFYQEIQGMKVMLEDYNSHKDSFSEEGRSYLKARIQKRVSTIYEAYFLRFQSAYNHQLMVDFDTFLRQLNPEVYQLMDGYTWGHYHYVRQWRKSYPKSLPLLKFIRLIKPKNY